MKKLKAFTGAIVLTLISCLAIALVSSHAFAEEAVQPLSTWISSVWDLVKGAKGMGPFVLASGIVKLLVDATKTEKLRSIFHKLSDSSQMYVLMGLSMLGVGLPVKAAGGSWFEAIYAMFQGAGGAMLLNELLKRVFKIGVAPKVAALK